MKTSFNHGDTALFWKVSTTTDKALINMELIDIEVGIKMTASKPSSLESCMVPPQICLKAMQNTRPLAANERLYIKPYIESGSSKRHHDPLDLDEFKSVDEPAPKKVKGGKGRGKKR